MQHVELLLQANGFALLSEGVPNKVSAKEKAEQKATVQTVTDEFFAEYLQTHDRSLEKFGKLKEAVQYLGLEGESNETLQFYQGYLTDKHKRSKHDDVVRLLRDDFYVHNKLAEARNNTFDVKVDKSAYQKVLLVRQLEETFGLERLGVEFLGKAGNVPVDDEFYQKVRTAFDKKKKKPTTYKELQQLYVSMLRHLSPDVVTSTKSKRKETRDVVEYALNKEALMHHTPEEHRHRYNLVTSVWTPEKQREALG